MGCIILTLPGFPVNATKVQASLKSSLSSNFNGLTLDNVACTILFVTDPSADDTTAVNTYWGSLNSSSFNPTPTDIANMQLAAATAFGLATIQAFQVQMLIAGLVPASKAAEAADYLLDLQSLLNTGSLYGAIAEIDSMTSAGVPSDLSPFITAATLAALRLKITTFLGI